MFDFREAMNEICVIVSVYGGDSLCCYFIRSISFIYIYGFVLPTRAYKVLTFATGHNLCSPFVAPTLRLMGTLSDLRYIQPRILPVGLPRYVQLAISVHNHCGPIGISNNVKMASHYDSIQFIQSNDWIPIQ